MKVIIILVLVLVLVGGGGFAAWKFFGDQIANFAGDLMKPSEKPTALFDMEPFTIPLIEDHQVRRFLIVHVALEVTKGEGETVVKGRLPYLRDAYIRYLLALASLDISPGIKDLEFLRGRLLEVSHRAVGPGLVKNVLFEHVFERPL
ncbi:MAG: flagellar basal body-associated FliL family protein [Alphaproteobacteria bacterium]|nr:flagellar basal body-associated FliL family protein [Alphaproteobacteria bacterium]